MSFAIQKLLLHKGTHVINKHNDIDLKGCPNPFADFVPIFNLQIQTQVYCYMHVKIYANLENLASGQIYALFIYAY